MTINERIDAALAARGMSLRALQSSLKKLGGTSQPSYPAIHRYARKDTQPPADFLAAFVTLLRIWPEWLLLGTGPMTMEEYTARRTHDAAPYWHGSHGGISTGITTVSGSYARHNSASCNVANCWLCQPGA